MRTIYWYSLLDPTKNSYAAVISSMTAKFNLIPWWGVYKPIFNLAGTQVMIKNYENIALPSNCVIEADFDPDDRVMSERQEPIAEL